jgi:hypothetical protein
MRGLGFEWVPTMRVGRGCKVCLWAGELPLGRQVVEVSRHSKAVIDGVIRDRYDPSRNGMRGVDGYWRLKDKDPHQKQSEDARGTEQCVMMRDPPKRE